MKLRTFLCCFVATFALTLFAGAADIVDSGTCGDNLTWTLDSDGVLTISGTGAMDDWGNWNLLPWSQNYDSIVTVMINNGVTSIGDIAFSGCEKLTSVTIPDSVISIGKHVFDWCESLTSVTIPDSVTSIGDWAFGNCKSLTGVIIPDSVTFIGDAAFIGCKGLTGVTISSGVTSIGASAFSSCESLTSVTIPDSVTSIGGNAFSNCKNLKDIFVNSDNQHYISEIGVLFDKNRSMLICYPAGKQGPYEIPDSVITIGSVAFGGCNSLTSIIIPDGVTTIGSDAFYNCKNLTSVTIPDSVTSIGENAFLWCENLTSVTISNSVTIIGDNAFSGCKSLTSVTIPDGVTSIGHYAFSNCKSLTNITIPVSMVTIEYGAFGDCINLTDVYYGGSATQWSEIRRSGYNVALRNATIHYNAKNVDIEITLTDKNGKTVDANGQTGDTPETKENAFQGENELAANFAVVDPDAFSGLVTARLFMTFYDKNGFMLSLTQREIDLSDPLNLKFVLNLTIPEGAKTLKIFMLGDNLKPLRAARLIESSADAA